VTAKRRNSNQQIPNLNQTIGDFWSWAYSHVLSNVSRGVYAEFLVGSALNVVDDVRDDWGDYDLVYRNFKIEVKASGYWQAWEQSKESQISFKIASKEKIHSRVADVYVFCLYTDREDNVGDVIDPSRWEFYIVPEKMLPIQQSISLNPLARLCERESLDSPVQYDNIKKTIDLYVKEF